MKCIRLVFPLKTAKTPVSPRIEKNRKKSQQIETDGKELKRMALKRKESKQTETNRKSGNGFTRYIKPAYSIRFQPAATHNGILSSINSLPTKNTNGANGNKSKRIALNGKESKRMEKNRKTGEEVAEYMPLWHPFCGFVQQSRSKSATGKQ